MAETTDPPNLSVPPGLAVPSESAVRMLLNELPRIQDQVDRKLAIDRRFECSGISWCEQTESVRTGHSWFGRSLVGAYAFSLLGELPGLLAAFAAPLQARGADEGFFRSLLRAWVGELHATLKDPEAEELAAPLEWLGQELGHLLGARSGEPVLDEAQEDFLELLLERKRRGAAEFALRRLTSQGVEKVLTALLMPAMGGIGWLWQQGAINAAQEHAATLICRYVMFRLFDALPVTKTLGRRAIVACAPGEEHELGAEMMAGYLEAKGWEVFFIGHSAPKEDILASVREMKPDVVMLSATMIASLPAARELARDIRSQAPRTRLVAGGTAAVLAQRELAGSVDEVVDDLEAGCRAAGERASG